MKLLREITDASMKDRGKFVHNIIKKHYDKEYEDKIAPDEKKAIEDYQIDSREVNDYHWKKNKKENIFSGIGKKHIENVTKGIDNVMSKSKTPHKLHVYSGTIHDPRNIKNDEGIVHHPAFLSTTINENFGRQRAKSHAIRTGDAEGHMLKIHVPKDHPGIYVPSVNPDAVDTNEHEREFILPHGTNLKHIKTTIEEGKKKKLNIHHMKVVL